MLGMLEPTEVNWKTFPHGCAKLIAAMDRKSPSAREPEKNEPWGIVVNWARDDPRPGAKKQRTRETQQQASFFGWLAWQKRKQWWIKKQLAIYFSCHTALIGFGWSRDPVDVVPWFSWSWCSLSWCEWSNSEGGGASGSLHLGPPKTLGVCLNTVFWGS